MFRVFIYYPERANWKSISSSCTLELPAETLLFVEVTLAETLQFLKVIFRGSHDFCRVNFRENLFLKRSFLVESLLFVEVVLAETMLFETLFLKR